MTNFFLRRISGRLSATILVATLLLPSVVNGCTDILVTPGASADGTFEKLACVL